MANWKWYFPRHIRHYESLNDQIFTVNDFIGIAINIVGVPIDTILRSIDRILISFDSVFISFFDQVMQSINGVIFAIVDVACIACIEQSIKQAVLILGNLINSV